ncbi:cyclase family protein [Methanolobus sp. ZRKC5]|uniref:cyclase family protein n=1 Tax=Methanolobus sp. ZRKC5 TaxID=3136295 RepID=UPI00313C6120
MSFNVIDITTGISVDTPVYDGDPEPLIERVSSIENDGFVVSRMSIGTHTGTHVDAPSHIFVNGKSVDELTPGSFMGKAVLLDLSSGDGCITEDELEKCFVQYINEEDLSVLLIKTEKHSNYCKSPDSGRMLAATAGNWIMDNGFTVVGVDTLSVDSEFTLPNHNLFLRNGLSIVEYLHLSEVRAGIYFFICLPLKLIGCDGAPARAILMDKACFI